MINHNIPHKYLFVDLSFMGLNEVRKCVVHAIQSYGGKALLFHVLLDCGWHISRVPLSYLRKSEKLEKEYPLHMLQLWDCFSDNVTYIEFDYLTEARVKVLFKDKSYGWGMYIGTVDWYDNGFTDEPTQFKQGHLVLLDSGQMALQPNNRLQFFDMSFTGAEPPDYGALKTIQEFPSVECVSEKWIIDNDNYFYEPKERTEDRVSSKPDLPYSESERVHNLP